MPSEIILLLFFGVIIIVLTREVVKNSKPNFCRDCKYFYAKIYCTHPLYKKQNYVTGTSWSPFAVRVRYNRPHCKQWEKKEEKEKEVFG